MIASDTHSACLYALEYETHSRLSQQDPSVQNTHQREIQNRVSNDLEELSQPSSTADGHAL